MCGIFGIVQKGDKTEVRSIFRSLFLLSESRGKEASGFAVRKETSFRVFKTPFPASDMVRSRVFEREIIPDSGLFAGIGHSRLVTNGYEHHDKNNQPVVKNGFIVVHNGIIVNDIQLWQKYGSSGKLSDLDSELIPTILKDRIDSGSEMGAAINMLFNELSGMTNIAMLSGNNKNLILATNNGSLYYIDESCNGLFVFASERFILKQLIKKCGLTASEGSIKQLLPGEIASLNYHNLSFELIKFGERLQNLETIASTVAIEYLEENNQRKIYINASLDHSIKSVKGSFIDTFNRRKEKIDQLKRCSKCLLPETFPYIKYDDEGVCNYCHGYHKIEYKGQEELLKVADTYRRKDGKPDCLVPFSGGRDSSFALHYIIRELKLKPIAYSYDWGMLTDLGRRNQARMCGKLGVEHILVSADIRKKRDNIRKNVLAWLKSPDLGTVPLFMAGDKQYFYFANLLMKQNDLHLSILGENMLETTNFKSGFCGITPDLKKGHTYSLSLSNKLRMVLYYGKQYITNPAYINSSLFDTLDAFKSYYVIKHSNLNIFDYLKWDEQIIRETIIDEYEWETDPGTTATWRIGDGTAAFYNYIYYTIGGFTENDTFRSNQIREGDLSREEAFEKAKAENMPRWDSIQWYCRTIGIDFEKAIEIINSTRTLYDK